MSPGYEMQWLGEMVPDRLDALRRCELDADDIVLLYQDLIEAGLFPPEWHDRVLHMVDCGLLHVQGRGLH